MLPAAALSGCPWSNDLVDELSHADFRHEYMMDQVRSYIAFQIRALREQPGRRWSQGDLAKKANKTQSVISRIEDPDYGKLSLQTCLEIANAYDLPLLVQFVEWDDWLSRMSNVSPSAMRKRSFDAKRLFDMNRQMNRTASSTANDSAARPSLQQRSLGYVDQSVGTANANVNANTDSASIVDYSSMHRAMSGSAAQGASA